MKYTFRRLLTGTRVTVDVHKQLGRSKCGVIWRDNRSVDLVSRDRFVCSLVDGRKLVVYESKNIVTKWHLAKFLKEYVRGTRLWVAEICAARNLEYDVLDGTFYERMVSIRELGDIDEPV